MKFVKENTAQGVLIPRSALKLSGLDNGPLELHVLDGAALLFRGRMTARELLKTVEVLNKTASGLLIELAEVCGGCTACDPDCLFAEEREIDGAPEELAETMAEVGVCLSTLQMLVENDMVIRGREAR